MERLASSLWLRKDGLNFFTSSCFLRKNGFSVISAKRTYLQHFRPWRYRTLKPQQDKKQCVKLTLLPKTKSLGPRRTQEKSMEPQAMSSDVEMFRNFNAAGQYDKTIHHFESSKPYLFHNPSSLEKKDQDIFLEYLKALVMSGRVDKLRWTFFPYELFKIGGSTQDQLPEFRLRLEDNSNQPLKIALKSSHPKNYFFFNLIKYSISTLLCLATISIIIERAMDSLPKGLGFPVGKKVNPVTDVKETLDDVKGCDEVKQELQEIIAYLKDPQKFNRLGGKLPKGVLLAGQPGTGKTLLARAIAGEANVPFIQSSAAEFEEMFVGVGARRVRELFATAKKMAPVIVFIDEMDAVGSRRAFKDSSSARMTLNQLLVELDGFQQNQGVVVICATNSPEALDPALTRAGRFDKTIHVPLPDIQGREEILRHFGSRVILGDDVDMRALARITAGMTGADLFNLINIAAVRCSSENQSFISMKALESALDRIIVGLERRNPMSQEEKKITSIHEAGHTIAGWLTPGADPVYKATIMARGSSLGVTWHAPDSDRYQKKLYEMEAQLTVCMAGRAAEDLVFGPQNVTSGCSGDLKSATALAREMVMHYGFGLENNKVSAYIANYSEISSELRRQIDIAVQKRLDEAYSRAMRLLKTHVDLVHRLSEALLELETLSREEIDLALKGDLNSIFLKRKLHKASSR